MALTKTPIELSSTPSIVDGGNATAITIDSSENVGIGTSSPSSQLEIDESGSGDATIKVGNAQNVYTTNVGKQGATAYGATAAGAAFLYTFNNDISIMSDGGTGSIKFTTGGNTQKMVLDASGNLVVGGTSLNAASSVGFTAAGNIRQVFASGVANDSLFGAISGVSNGFQIAQDTSNNQSYIFHNGGTASVTIDAAGSVGIGGNPIGGAKLGISKSTGGDVFILTDTSSADLIVNCTSGVTRMSPSTGTLALGTGNVEKMRIDSSGRVCVNTSSDIALGRVSIAAGLYNTDIGMVIKNTNTTYGSNTSYIDFRNSGNGIAGRISHTAGTTVNYGTSSDERLKTNIQDADDAGALIDSIQVRKFDWIADGTHQDYGMVAQELNLISPLAAPSTEDPNEMMGVDYSKLVPMLVKEIQSLRSRVAQLENN